MEVSFAKCSWPCPPRDKIPDLAVDQMFGGGHNNHLFINRLFKTANLCHQWLWFKLFIIIFILTFLLFVDSHKMWKKNLYWKIFKEQPRQCQGAWRPSPMLSIRPVLIQKKWSYEVKKWCFFFKELWKVHSLVHIGVRKGKNNIVYPDLELTYYDV